MKTFKITSMHSVYIDDFNKGELENVNNYDLSQTIKANDLKEAIQKYFDTVLCYDFDFKYANIDEDQKCVFYSVLVDNDNLQIKSDEAIYKKWKQSKATLYANQITIYSESLNEVFLTNLNH